jgi:hypothetical protein
MLALEELGIPVTDEVREKIRESLLGLGCVKS